MPPKAVRPRRDINYLGIEFAEGIVGENQRSRYHKLFKRDVLATRYPDDVALRALSLFDSVRWMLNNLGGSRTTDTAHFRMFNRNYSINQDQLADLLSFSHGDEFACQHPLESEWESSAFDFWQQLTGKTTTGWEGLKATAIQNPPIQYLHRILASTIFGPITSIALALNLGTELAMLKPLETPFADLDYCRSMLLIKNKPDSKYFMLISTSSGYQPREEHIQRQQEEMRVTIDQIRETQLDFVERTELNMGDLIEQLTGVHLEVEGMREYM
ncbi:hypothetical protein KIW84_032703 [Lathyrus oleraceus]|uniref:Arabidopsis retrotransposon Orf1 C-terminal domain-containing protein n=1 Tax=Pisum sativum TaxID=3888 RepID=A0A9D4XUY0_PEA|nr:hypothetical protein KIW84_032703 [Pisum sativum]